MNDTIFAVHVSVPISRLIDFAYALSASMVDGRRSTGTRSTPTATAVSPPCPIHTV